MIAVKIVGERVVKETVAIHSFKKGVGMNASCKQRPRIDA